VRTRAEDEALTFHIAWKYFCEEKTTQEVADELRVERSFVSRRLKEARLRGMVHILVTPPVRVQELRGLERRLKSQFPLAEAVVLPGREDVMDAEESPDKESVVLACCQAAAQWLADTLKDGETLAVPWGRVASYIAGQLNQLAPSSSLKNLVTVPIVGVTGVTTHPFEANTIAARIAATLGGRSLLLAAPAVVTPEQYEVVAQLPLVRRVLERVRGADVVITPVAAADPRTSTVVRQGLARPEEIEYLMEQGAVGQPPGAPGGVAPGAADRAGTGRAGGDRARRAQGGGRGRGEPGPGGAPAGGPGAGAGQRPGHRPGDGAGAADGGGPLTEKAAGARLPGGEW
jgi:DNA-binding transcriptional regulator LsrR (DeoR family)